MKAKTLRPVAQALAAYGLDQDLLVSKYGEARRPLLIGVAINPSLRAALLFRLAAQCTGWRRLVARNLLLSLHGCDIGPGAQIDGAIYIPYPTGIVIGKGVSIGDKVSIYQGVTIGADRKGRYPSIGDGVTIYSNAVVVGGITIGPGATIGATEFVRTDVRAGATVSS